MKGRATREEIQDGSQNVYKGQNQENNGMLGINELHALVRV